MALPQLSHLYSSALYLTKDKAEAEDLVQETYLRAFRFFDKFETGTNIRAWLLSIQRNLLLPPMNVRDGLGGIVDKAMNPINYLIPFAANADAGTTAGALIGITVTDVVNQRSLNLETFEGIEEAVIDLYSAVRNGYQQQREAKIKE